MKTESQRSFRHGFLLTEQELRRILDSLAEQLKRAEPQLDPIIKFEIKYRNGAVSETSQVDDVLSIENFGSSSIVRLEIDARNKKENPDRQLLVRFINADIDEDSWVSIHYTVKGQERDWVFIASSQIEERISKIKVAAVNQLFTKKYSVLVQAFMMIPLFVIFYLLIQREPNVGEKIETLWKTGQIKDPIEAIVMVEKAKRATTSSFVWIPAVAVLSVSMLTFLLPMLASYLSPAYNSIGATMLTSITREEI